MTWANIPDFPGYQVSVTGEIRSTKKSKPKTIAQHQIKGKGYCRVTLWKEGKKSNHLVHRLVALAHLKNPNPFLYDQVDHIDRDRANNNVTNLRWIDYDANMMNRGGRFARKKEADHYNQWDELELERIRMITLIQWVKSKLPIMDKKTASIMVAKMRPKVHALARALGNL